MDMHRRDSSGSHGGIPEVRLILVGNIGCGKTETAGTLLNDSLLKSPPVASRLSEVRGGVSEGRHLRIVETPRWYWNGNHIDASMQKEADRALSLVAPGPHAFLILVPVGQFTEMDGRIPTELERVFGRGALNHSLVLLTCGDYLLGRDHDRYVRMDESGLGALVNECGGRWHVINNRRQKDRQQVISLLEKVEQLIESSGGCYLPSATLREAEERVNEKEHELQRRYSLQERELVQRDQRALTQTTWSQEETWEESGRRGKIRVRSMGPVTGRVFSQQLANGLPSQSSDKDSPVGLMQKSSSFKLSKDGAILSQLSETEQPVRNQNTHNFFNTIHYQISTAGVTSSAPPSLPSPTAAFTSYSPSSSAFSSLSSATVSSASSTAISTSSTNFSSYSSATLPSSPTNASFSPSSNALSSSSSTKFSSYSSTTLPSSPTNASFSPTSNALSSSFSTKFSSYSSTTLPSSPTNASFSPSSNVLSSSSSTNVYSYLSPTLPSSPTSYNDLSSSNALSSSSSHSSASFRSSSTAVSSSSPSTNASLLSSSTAFSSSSPSTNDSFSSSSTAFSSFSPRTNASFSSSSTAISSRPTTVSSSSFSSASSDELRLVLLGRTGSGKSAAGNVILGREEFKLRRNDATGATTQSCVKGTAVIGQKRVAVVDTPDWFGPSCPPEKLATHLSSCMDLCAPGPHAFLLCVPVTLPGRSNLHDLASIRNSFGPDAILRHTLVLFTHSDKLKDGNEEEYIAAKRPELLDLVEKCGDRYHVLKQGRNGGNVEDLLEKLEQLVKESGGSHYSDQGQGEFGRERMIELQSGRGGKDDIDRALTATLHSLREEEEVEQEEKNAKPVESTASSVTSVLGSILRFVGQKVGEGAKQVPKLVAGGAVLGGVLGLYVGGPVGGAVGATAGTVATEYGRRKYSKPKTD